MELPSLRLCLCVAIVALCFLAPSAAAASEPEEPEVKPAYTHAPGSPVQLGEGEGGTGVAFSPNGSLLAQGTALFSVGASAAPTPVGGPPPDPNAAAVAFSPSGRLLAAVNEGTLLEGGDTVSLFSVGSSGALMPVPGSPFVVGLNPGSVTFSSNWKVSVTFSPNGRLLAVITAGEPESLHVFSVSASGALTRSPAPHTAWKATLPSARGAACSPRRSKQE